MYYHAPVEETLEEVVKAKMPMSAATLIFCHTPDSDIPLTRSQPFCIVRPVGESEETSCSGDQCDSSLKKEKYAPIRDLGVDMLNTVSNPASKGAYCKSQ